MDLTLSCTPGSVLAAAADIRKTKKMESIVDFKTWKAGEQNMNLFIDIFPNQI